MKKRACNTVFSSLSKIVWCNVPEKIAQMSLPVIIIQKLFLMLALFVQLLMEINLKQ